jgi:hypothetical protein
MGHKKPGSADLLSFEAEKGLIIPGDLKEYFLTNNGTDDNCDENLYCFYPFNQFTSVNAALEEWKGIPDYSNIVNTLEGCEFCFVFADYMFHLFTYGIRLYKERRDVNEVYAICGDQYKVIARSFNEFMQLYATESDELFF